MCKKGLQGFRSHLWLQRFHASIRFLLTPCLAARDAFVRAPQEFVSLRQRPVDFRHGRAPEGESLCADGFGDVEGAGVAGEEEVGGFQEGGEFEEGGFASDGERSSARVVCFEGLAGFFDIGRVALGAGEDDLDVFGHGGEGFAEISGRPVLAGGQFLSGQVVRTQTMRMGRAVSMPCAAQNCGAKPERVSGSTSTGPGSNVSGPKPSGASAV